MTNIHHHLEKPVELLRNLIPSLKEGGLVAIVERDKDRTSATDEATRRDDLIRQTEAAGFEVTHADTSMQEDKIHVLRPKGVKH